MDTKFLEIKNVAAGYGGGNVIEDIDFCVERGECFGLIGLNGVGKTTLIKTILGLRQQTSGTIFVNGFEAGTAGAKKEIAYLPERFDPAWFLNAYEFADFTLSLYGQKVQRQDVDTMAIKLGLDPKFLSKRAQTYSKGMRQKLGLITTFLTACPLLILDEPMSGLDPLARSQVKSLMIDAKKAGRTVFVCSHILSDLEELCDRIAIIHDKQIRFIGKPQGLLDQSAENHLEKAFLSLIKSKVAA